MDNTTVKYKNMEDHIGIKYVPENYTGYDNPYVEVILKRGKYDETHERMIKSCIADALLRFGVLSQIPFKAELKP